MKRTVSFIAALDIAFVGLLVMSSIASGIASDILYYSAFSVPILLGLWAIRYKGGEVLSRPSSVSESAKFSLPLIFPTIAAVSLIAFLTSSLLNLVGYESTVSFPDPFPIAVLTRAVLPALLEEILFRFIPIRLLKAEGADAKFSILFTALAFSLGHTNLFQIPYAAFAGAVFALLFIATGSIIPTVIAHLLNNLISLITIYYDFDLWVYISIAVLAVLSLIVIVLRRYVYKERIKELFSKELDFTLTRAAAVYMAICLTLSILTLKTR